MNGIDSMVTDAKRTIQAIKQIDPKAVNACDYLEKLIDRIAGASLLSKLDAAEKALENVVKEADDHKVEPWERMKEMERQAMEALQQIRS